MTERLSDFTWVRQLCGGLIVGGGLWCFFHPVPATTAPSRPTATVTTVEAVSEFPGLVEAPVAVKQKRFRGNSRTTGTVETANYQTFTPEGETKMASPKNSPAEEATPLKSLVRLVSAVSEAGEALRTEPAASGIPAIRRRTNGSSGEASKHKVGARLTGQIELE